VRRGRDGADRGILEKAGRHVGDSTTPPRRVAADPTTP
jgi:hypothetical protein